MQSLCSSPSQSHDLHLQISRNILYFWKKMAIRKGFKTFPELSWAYTACVYNLLQENKNGAVLFLRRKRYFRGTASLLPQTSSGTCLSRKHSRRGVSFSAPAKDYWCNGCCTSSLPWDRLNAGIACSILISLCLCPGRDRLGSSLQNPANVSVGWISFLYPSVLLWV